VAVDLSSHSAATVGYAAQFAQAFGASLTLAHVCPPEPVNPLIVTPEVFTAPERQRAAAQEAVAELAQSVRLTCPHCQGRVLTGEPADQIAQLARDLNADLIITAGHHPGRLRRLFNLDHAVHILHRAPCPVLVYYDKEEWIQQEFEGRYDGQ